jgi:hypothetical protein
LSETTAAPIGGYFELELPPPGHHFHQAALRFQSGRCALAHELLERSVRKLYVPYLSCASILEPLDFHHIEYNFYRLSEEMEIEEPPILAADERLLYIDYFGIKSAYASTLAGSYGGSLILDNTQSFFTPPPNQSPTFYSPRKFLGVPDGGYLNTTAPVPRSHFVDAAPQGDYTHLIGRITDGPQLHFREFQASEARLRYSGRRPMSRLSERLLASIDYEYAMERRKTNFAFLHVALEPYNRLDLAGVSNPGPFCYPLRTSAVGLRGKLIEARIFVATYWPEVLERLPDPGFPEHSLVNEIIPLPVDQRYSESDMERIVSVVQRGI